MNIADLSIDIIKFSTRAGNVLRKNGIDSIEKLLKLDRDMLMSFKNSGTKSTNEILEIIESIKNNKISEVVVATSDNEEQVSIPKDFYAWIKQREGKKFVVKFFENAKIDVLKLLSPRAYNLLRFNDIEDFAKLIYLDDTKLLAINHMDTTLVKEINNVVSDYLEEQKDSIIKSYCAYQKDKSGSVQSEIINKLYIVQFQPIIKEFLKQNDKNLAAMDLSNRAKNVLKNNGYENISDIFHLDEEYFKSLKNSGSGTAKDIVEKIHAHIKLHEERLEAYLNGDKSVLLDESVVAEKILALYNKDGFKGLSLQNIKDEMSLPDTFPDTKLKPIIGRLIAAEELEYVDFRCYRVYRKFEDCLNECDKVSERDRGFVIKRLQGITLEDIGLSENLTRERVRQIVDKVVQKVQAWNRNRSGTNFFDEDYYIYLYSTYAFDKKEAGRWLGIPDYVWKYFNMIDIKQGSKDLNGAVDDVKNLDAGLRLKIKNYLNRNKLFIDGVWVELKRKNLEDVLAKKFCQTDITCDEFRVKYNAFLKQEGVSEDKNVYMDDSVYRTRKNKLSESKVLIWKQHETLRYYDIESRDYTDLFDGLNLDAYKNIEFSTAKLFRENLELMAEYDIHDHYELHNLLRKILLEGSYNDFRCGRMPNISFGNFDRFSQIYNVLLDNAPIAIDDLADIVSEMYGYDPDVVKFDYLIPFNEYFHNGIYRIDHEVMSNENRELLRAELTDEFYFFSELREIYQRIAPNASIKEINPFNLKSMGFKVNSSYILINKDTADKYYESILTTNDIVDITRYKKRFAALWNFFTKLAELKRNFDVIEFEHNKLINFRKLERSGITKTQLKNYCEAVSKFVEENNISYFSIQYLRYCGFKSELDNLGFGDTFYASLIKATDKYATTQAYNTEIFSTSASSCTKLSFLEDCVKQAGIIDALDLADELSTSFGCQIKGKNDIVYFFDNSNVYYDPILDRLYADIDLYYDEIDSMEGN